ncbi:MAG: NAD-dependent epimerase/dehydratase family protein [Acidimicrobiales bacterium]
MMRAVVTGGAGHIGSHVVDELVAAGYSVTVVDDLSNGSLDNLAHHGDNVTFTKGTVADADLVAHVTAGADVVFHLASAVGVQRVLNDPTGAAAIILDGTRAVVDACVRNETRLVFASSSEVYGNSRGKPMDEEDDLAIGPPTSPRWSYALAKALGEQFVLDAATRGMPATILRYFNSYGPRAHRGPGASVVARFVDQALAGGPVTIYGDGSQVRSFTHVGDLARLTALAGSQPAAVGEVFNAGNREPTTIADLATLTAELVADLTSTPAVDVVATDPQQIHGWRFVEPHRRVPRTDRAMSKLQWCPVTSIADGLRSTIAWHLANPIIE